MRRIILLLVMMAALALTADAAPRASFLGVGNATTPAAQTQASQTLSPYTNVVTTASIAAFLDPNYVPPSVLGTTVSQQTFLNGTNATNATNATNQTAIIGGVPQMIDTSSVLPSQTAQWPGKDGTLKVATSALADFLNDNYVPGSTTEYVVETGLGYKKGVMG